MQTKIKVEGMTCSHCENAVNKAVSAISGVANVIVDLAEKTATVTHNDKVTADSIKREVEEQGYDVITMG